MNKKVILVNDSNEKFVREILKETTDVEVLKTESVPVPKLPKSSKFVAHYPSYKLGTLQYSKKLPGRNEPCSCGSGKKFKKCCLDKINEKARAAVVEATKKNEERGR